MPRKAKLNDAEAWEQLKPFFNGQVQMDANELRDALTEAGRDDLMDALPGIKAAGYFKGYATMRDNRPVHVYVIGGG